MRIVITILLSFLILTKADVKELSKNYLPPSPVQRLSDEIESSKIVNGAPSTATASIQDPVPFPGPFQPNPAAAQTGFPGFGLTNPIPGNFGQFPGFLNGPANNFLPNLPNGMPNFPPQAPLQGFPGFPQNFPQPGNGFPAPTFGQFGNPGVPGFQPFPGFPGFQQPQFPGLNFPQQGLQQPPFGFPPQNGFQQPGFGFSNNLRKLDTDTDTDNDDDGTAYGTNGGYVYAKPA